MVLGIILGFLGLFAALGLALWVAVRVNGPAVLNTVDRLSSSYSGLSQTETIFFGDSPQQKLYVISHEAEPKSPKPATGKPVVIFIHGGSWQKGDPEDYGFVGRALASDGFVVVNAGYRLGNAGKYPAMLQDAASAVRWALNNIADYGGDPNSIYLMGHSAGAYNAVMTALEPQWLEAEGVESSAIKGVIGLAGPYDFLPLSGEGVERAFGDVPDPAITQPVNFERADAPPMLLMTGDADTTVRPRNTEALAKALTDAGHSAVQTHSFPGVSHARIIMNFASPWRGSSDVAARTSAFIQAQQAAPQS
jgi:acetyl esterase/lipase